VREALKLRKREKVGSCIMATPPFSLCLVCPAENSALQIRRFEHILRHTCSTNTLRIEVLEDTLYFYTRVSLLDLQTIMRLLPAPFVFQKIDLFDSVFYRNKYLCSQTSRPSKAFPNEYWELTSFEKRVLYAST